MREFGIIVSLAGMLTALTLFTSLAALYWSDRGEVGDVAVWLGFPFLVLAVGMGLHGYQESLIWIVGIGAQFFACFYLTVFVRFAVMVFHEAKHIRRRMKEKGQWREL